MLEVSIEFLKAYSLLIPACTLLVYLTYNRYGRGLAKYPGPFLASLSSAWRVWDVWSNGDKTPYVYLHQQYGPIVRISPHRLSFQNPAAIKDIYGPQGLMQKGDMHLVTQRTSKGESFPTLFSNTNAEWHKNLRRKVSPAFSMTTMVQYEEYVDETIEVFLRELEQRYANRPGPEGIVDFPLWLHYYTEEAVTNVTYGKRMGYLENGDPLGILEYTNTVLFWSIFLVQWPSLDYWTWKNPVLMWLNKHDWFNQPSIAAVPFALNAQQQRRELREKRRAAGEHGEFTLTDRFLSAQEEHGESFGPRELLGLGLSIIIAGSETTAISLCSLFYHLLKTPSSYGKLQSEIDSAFPSGTPITFAKAQGLPYLSAVIKEAFRMHPAATWAPERVVPAGGHTIAGEHIPAGTVVSVSAWVVHRDPNIFGEDVNAFRPERWIPGAAEGADEAKVRDMERHLLQFGVGAYNCMGRNIALMEMYRVVPALLGKFELSLAYPDKSWRFLPGAFVNVADFEVRLKLR